MTQLPDFFASALTICVCVCYNKMKYGVKGAYLDHESYLQHSARLKFSQGVG